MKNYSKSMFIVGSIKSDMPLGSVLKFYYGHNSVHQGSPNFLIKRAP